MNATISGDIISSTSLQKEEFLQLTSDIKSLFEQISEKYNTHDLIFWGRLIKGDYIECYIKDPKISLRIALLIKAFVKKTEIANIKEKQKQRNLFKKHAIRLAIGIGDMRIVDLDNNIMDGDAIYLSGRKINEQSKSNNEKVTIKNTLFFESNDKKLRELGSVFMGLLDELLMKSTSRQCYILYYKLLGYNESEISRKLRINQAAVNQHSTAIGWNAIENTLNYFETMTFE